ncbi:hypothetical protein E3N88_41875 [Mikania micrantha]|uniref:Arabidopsis retrotransposon Orf1 C-terminal domain-containing protein n=1 Tax=Mikania micrantha TaxID=192012 RepID=A0A5N6LJC9_9ASTR|nr:hypothetical protein E3N88_41875 [Mikania micrantha]
MSSSDEMEVVGDDMGPHVDDLDVEHFDELIDHPWLQFPQGTIARSRRDRLLRKEMGHQKAIDYDLLAQLGQQERMMAIIGEDTPLSCLFEMTYAPQYRLITVEFLSTFRYRPQVPDFQPQQAEISFRLCGFPYHLSLAEFGSVLGLYTEEETQMPIYTTAIHTADDAVVSAWWPRIGDELFFRSARVTRIRDPLIRYLHRCIASSVTGVGDRATLHGVWRSILAHITTGSRGADLRGVCVTRIARFNGLIDLEPAGMEAFHPVRLDRRTVQGMHIVQKFPQLGLRFSLEKGVCAGRLKGTDLDLDFAESILVNRSLFEVGNVTESPAMIPDEGDGITPLLQSGIRRTLRRNIKILQIVVHIGTTTSGGPAKQRQGSESVMFS